MRKSGIVVFVVAATCVALIDGCGGGGGGGGGGGTTTSTSTVSGNATKGTISGADVEIFSINADGSLNASLGTGTTNSMGAYSISITSPSGPIAVRIKGNSGCTHTDEATGTAVAFTANDSLLAYLPTPTGTTVTANVTPLTHMAALRIQQAAPSSSSALSTVVTQVNGDIGTQFNVSDIITVTPSNMMDGFPEASMAETTEYAMVLAGMSREALDQNVTAMTLVNAIAQDFQSDGLFNGQTSGGSSISLGAGTLSSTACTTTLGNAIANFLNSTQNTSGVTTFSAETFIDSFTPTSAPSAPTGVVATAGDGSATLNWNAVTGATSYNVYMASQTGVSPSNYSTLSGGMKHAGASSPYAHSGLTGGTTYYFVVTAVNSVGEGTASAQVSATPTGTGGGTTLATPLTVTTKSLTTATAGTAYSLTMSVAGTGPYSWTGATIAPNSTLNPVTNNGLSIGTSTGILSGTPVFSGTQPLFLKVSGANASVGIQYDYVIGGTGSSQNILGTPTTGTQGSYYEYEFRATWDQSGWPSFGTSTWVFGSIPPGMTFNTLTHKLTGYCSHAGAYTFTFFTDPVTTSVGPNPTNFRTVTVNFNPATPSTSPSGASNWTRQGSNPVLSPASTGWDGFLIGSPSVVKVGSTYYMYYEGQSDSTYRRAIGLATSTDGSTWTRSASNPVVAAGASGAWDEGGTRYPTVHHDGSQFWMWYQGTGSSGTKIGLATSTDGVTWSKSASNPVISGTGLISSIAPGGVVHNGTQFVLFVSLDGSIARMTSASGTAWTDTGTVFSPTSGTDVRFGRPEVILDNGTYRMWYTRIEALGGGAGNSNAVYPITVGYADSPDGITWTTYSNPILTAGAEGAWDRPCVGVPTVIKDGTQFKMWYVGGRGNLPGAYYDANAFVEGAIGYALIP